MEEGHPQMENRHQMIMRQHPTKKKRNSNSGRSAMNRKLIYTLFLVISLVSLGGCGGGGGSGSGTGTGTVSLDIADAKPFIDGAEQPDELWIVFDSVLVHTSGGGWVSLVMPETPFEINLLALVGDD
jgi:hypothetical protein